MRYIAKATALSIVLALLAPILVLAEDYVTNANAAQALQHVPVYVAPGTEGTDNYTAGKLQTRLNSDDNIVLVMLPAAAETEADISTLANRLSEKLGNQRIIGLSVDKKVVGFAPSLPVDVADDQMKRAASVSNDPVTALTTFVQNMHLWQIGQPKPKPTPTPVEQPSPQKEDQSRVVWFLVLAGIIVISFIAWAWVLLRHNSR